MHLNQYLFYRRILPTVIINLKKKACIREWTTLICPLKQSNQVSSKKVFSAFTHSLLCLRHRLLEFQKTWSLEEQKGSIQQNITKGHWLSFFLKFSSYLVISIIVASSIYLPEQTNLVSNDLYIWFLLCVLYLYMGYYLRLSLEAYNKQTNHCVLTYIIARFMCWIKDDQFSILMMFTCPA